MNLCFKTTVQIGTFQLEKCVANQFQAGCQNTSMCKLPLFCHIHTHAKVLLMINMSHYHNIISSFYIHQSFLPISKYIIRIRKYPLHKIFRSKSYFFLKKAAFI